MDLQNLIIELENLKKYWAYSGDSGPFASEVNFEEDEDGNWVKAEDVQKIVDKLKTNQL